MVHTRSEMIVEALRKKGVQKPCPRCESHQFSVVAETELPISPPPGFSSSGGDAMPAVIVACSNCGFVTLHALGYLELPAESEYA